MSDFSVAYAGLMDAEEQLYQARERLQEAASKLHLAAGNIGEIPSLADKGYAGKVRACVMKSEMINEDLGSSMLSIEMIAQRYAAAEKRVLQKLSDQVARGHLSSASSAIVDKALEGHKVPHEHRSLGRTIDETIESESVSLMVEGFRYWRSTTGKEMLEKWFGKDNMGIDLICEELNGVVEPWEDMYYAFLHPTNGEAWVKGGSALLGAVGLGFIPKLGKRYYRMSEGLSQRITAAEDEGRKGKAAVLKYGGYALLIGQATVDTIVNVGTFGLNEKIKKVAWKNKGGRPPTTRKGKMKKAGGELWKKTQKKTVMGDIKKLEEMGGDAGSKFGDWCWSRLDQFADSV